jgi:hypothetical protein
MWSKLGGDRGLLQIKGRAAHSGTLLCRPEIRR